MAFTLTPNSETRSLVVVARIDLRAPDMLIDRGHAFRLRLVRELDLGGLFGLRGVALSAFAGRGSELRLQSDEARYPSA